MSADVTRLLHAEALAQAVITEAYRQGFAYYPWGRLSRAERNTLIYAAEGALKVIEKASLEARAESVQINKEHEDGQTEDR